LIVYGAPPPPPFPNHGDTTTQGQPNMGSQSNGGYIQSKGHIAAMIPPVPKSKKGVPKHIQTSESSHNIASSYYRLPHVIRLTSWIQQNRPPKKSASARTCTHGTKSTHWRIRHWKSLYGRMK
jgi:hypothetical protein